MSLEEGPTAQGKLEACWVKYSQQGQFKVHIVPVQNSDDHDVYSDIWENGVRLSRYVSSSLVYYICKWFTKKQKGTREIDQRLKALTLKPSNPSLIPSVPM